MAVTASVTVSATVGDSGVFMKALLRAAFFRSQRILPDAA
jgi:hypothetical protein